MDIFRNNVVLIVRHYTISLRYLGTKKVYVKIVLCLDLFSSRTFLFIYLNLIVIHGELYIFFLLYLFLT